MNLKLQPALRSCSKPGNVPVGVLIALAAVMTEAKRKTIENFTPNLKGNSKFILGLKNVFSAQECLDLIYRSEEEVYEAALVNFGGENVYVVDKTARDSDRVMLDDPEFADEIFKRVRPWLPQRVEGYNVCGVNERLRFLRYDAAQRFAPHYDGCFERPDGSELSFLTIQVCFFCQPFCCSAILIVRILA